MVSPVRSMGISTRILLVVMTVLVVVVSINYVVFMRGYTRSAESAMVDRAAAFTAVADEAKNHQSLLMANGAVEIDKLIREAQEQLAKKEISSYAESKFFQTIPVVTGWTTAQNAAKREELEFEVVAFESRNKEHEPDSGSFEADMLKGLTEQVKSGGSETLCRINDSTNTLHYMRAIRLDSSCMMCHGDPKTLSKSGDGKDPLGFAMENWPVGYMHGAYEVRMPLTKMDAQVAGFFQTGMMWTVPLVIGAVVGFLALLRRLLSRPVAQLVGMMEDVATGEGDLTKRMGVKRGDEIGKLGYWFDEFMAKLQGVIREVAGVTNEVASASTQIAASSEEMSAAVSEVARQSSQAAHSAENSGRIATEGGQIVKTTVDRMQQIDQAVSESAASVTALGKRGAEIGQVISVINDIADQTNLLALNAAIEAARAGEHGRGFAVVADEVRKLADRTTRATEEIGGSIKAIQDETNTAVTRMSRGTDQVRAGVESAQKAGVSLEQIVTGASDVSSMITSISAASEEAGAGASQSSSAAAQLSQKAEQLRALVSKFKI